MKNDVSSVAAGVLQIVEIVVNICDEFLFINESAKSKHPPREK